MNNPQVHLREIWVSLGGSRRPALLADRTAHQKRPFPLGAGGEPDVHLLRLYLHVNRLNGLLSKPLDELLRGAAQKVKP